MAPFLLPRLCYEDYVLSTSKQFLIRVLPHILFYETAEI